VLDRTRRLAYKLTPSGTAEGFTRRLDLAGNPGSWTAERLMGAKGAGLLGGALVGFVLSGMGLRGLLWAGVGAVACFFLPDLLLYNTGLKRQEELQRGLADALDMLTVCVQAGQGFDSALLQVAKATTGPVSGEFARVLSEIQIGKSRGDAFSSLADRTSVPEVKTFVSALVQADRLGLPIANVLKEQSVQMRLVRRQRAEEKAQKVPIKILFPMLLCIFPALFVVIIGPGAIRMVDAFSGIG
jgi:tight adherence protein C